MSFLAHFLYVAVVIDTDGSAFITKAEFDSLKNNFQAQIDNYNSSIDSKIDGAIAAYLAGIKLSATEERVFADGFQKQWLIWDSGYTHNFGNWFDRVSFAYLYSQFPVDSNSPCFFLQTKFDTESSSSPTRNKTNKILLLKANSDATDTTGEFVGYSTDATISWGWSGSEVFKIKGYASGQPNVAGIILSNSSWSESQTNPEGTFLNNLSLLIGKNDNNRVNQCPVGHRNLWYISSKTGGSSTQDIYNTTSTLVFNRTILTDVMLINRNSQSYIWAKDSIEKGAWRYGFYQNKLYDALTWDCYGTRDPKAEMHINYWSKNPGTTNPQPTTLNTTGEEAFVKTLNYTISGTEHTYYSSKVHTVAPDLINNKPSDIKLNSNYNNIINKYSSFGYTGALTEGIPVDLFKETGTLDFEIDTTSIGKKCMIGFRTTPFPSTAMAGLADTKIETKIDSVLQATNFASVTPGTHNVSIKIKQKDTPLFFKICYDTSLSSTDLKSYGLFTPPAKFNFTKET